MTPKEKADQLIYKYMSIRWDIGPDDAIQCALIAVDEILNLDFNIKCDAAERCVMPVINFWQEVKQEIEKI